METDFGGLSYHDPSVREVSLPLYQCKGWIRFVGVLSIIHGALIAVSIVGIIVAWVPIWMGVLLCQAASAVEDAQRTGDRDAMIRSQERLKTYFVIMGILSIIGILIGVIYVIWLILFAASGDFDPFS